MCVIIIEGTQRLLEVELGVDYTAEWEGSAEDADFIKKNTGTGKRFPGGPKCRFQGKDVPCFSKISEQPFDKILHVHWRPIWYFILASW
mmetsp:Transcript_5580/g.10605  ORF Transcript_5580/g.10605 Transcript_5580/m.10605 type:complete len:89 (+) Transcript_5580:275-541(+)